MSTEIPISVSATKRRKYLLQLTKYVKDGVGYKTSTACIRIKVTAKGRKFKVGHKNVGEQRSLRLFCAYKVTHQSLSFSHMYTQSMKTEEGPDQGIRYIHQQGRLLQAFVRTPPPPENHENRFSLQYCSGSPRKITKLPSQHSMLGQHRPASETPFQWPFVGGTIMPHL